MDVLKWISQEGPLATKHHGWAHPLCTLVIHYAVASTVTFWSHDWLLGAPDDNDNDCQQVVATDDKHAILDAKLVALGVMLYAIWLLLWRCHHNHPSGVIYEYTWLCNVTLVLGAIALFQNRPIVATAHCVAVGMDQLMWYVDLVGWAWSGFTKFPIGVAKYVTWPGTSFATRLTCTHHLWTIPLFVTVARGVHPAALVLSVVIVVVNVLLSKWLTPFSLSNHNHKYLNVNLAYELWRDVKIDILQIKHDDPPDILYLFRLLWRWQCFNLLVFMFLYTSSHLLFGLESAPTCIE